MPERRFLRRYWMIVFYFARLTLHVIWWEVILRRVGLGGVVNRTAQSRYVRAARRFRAMAVQLGGVMIKGGQFLSTRVDVLPRYITEELESLQDEVPPVPTAAIYAELEAEWRAPVLERLAHFEVTPLAAASLGQTHRGQLPSGEAVVVKVRRPGIEDLVEVDLSALQLVSRWLRRYPPIARRADVPALLAEFAATLRDELDYMAEARNAERFQRMFADDAGVRIPLVYTAFCTDRVLVLENVGFIKITDYAAFRAAGIRRAEVAERLFKTYLRQIFNESFFHADPHPGNLFVEPPTDGRAWRLVFVDFGMVGEVTPKVRAALRESTIAVGTRDPQRLLTAMRTMDVLLPGADVDRIMEAQTEVFDRYWGKSMGELRQTAPEEIVQFTQRFRDLLFELPFQVPRNLIYLGRTVSILSGICTGLDPDFNLFSAVTPFAQSLLAEELGNEKSFAFWRDQVLEVLRRLVVLPSRLDTALARFERGQLTVNVRAEKDRRREADLPRALNRLTGAILTVAFLVVGTVLALNAQPTLGWVGWGMAVALLVWTLTR
jgi:predicted unusual protein kinase regulating ubiquinone biosynthesis (AarF/ABC1/UbiB family)